MTALKPCPACGGEARRGERYVECSTASCISTRSCDNALQIWDSLPRREEPAQPARDDERRFRAAVAAMQGLIAAGVCTQRTRYADGSVSEPWPVLSLAVAARLRADALLAELAKEKP